MSGNSRLSSRLVDESVFKGTVRTVTPTGTSADAANWTAAGTAMAAVGGKIIAKAGTHTITSDVTIPSNVVVEFMPGAVLDIASTKTVTLNGPVDGVATGVGAGTLITSTLKTKRVAFVGDSITTGSSTAPGGPRMAFFRRLRQVRGDVIAWGPAIAFREQALAIGDPRCAGYAGETVNNILTRCQAAGSIYVHNTNYGSPDVVYIQIGTNDVNAGDSAATVLGRIQTLCAQLDTIFPYARKVLCSITQFYTGSSPTGGIAAANAAVTTLNASLAAEATTRGGLWSYIDSAANLTRADHYTDGVHMVPDGAAKIGNAQAGEFERLFPVRVGPRMPRRHLLRPAQASALLTTKTTDQVVVTDSGFELAASNFLLEIRLRATDLTNAGVTAIAQCTPSGQNYTKGWLFAYDSTVTPKTFNWYMKSIAAVTAKAPTSITSRACKLFVHGDYANQIVGIYLATAPLGGGDWEVACLGMSTGVTQWTAGDASGQLMIGKNASFSGFAGAVDNVRFHKGSSVPGVDTILAAIERSVYEQERVPGLAAEMKLDEGTGTTPSTSNGTAGTLTGGWSAAGTVTWPSDDG